MSTFNKIEKFNKEQGEGVTLKKLRISLRKQHNIEVRNQLLRKILLRLGYKWVKSDKKGKMKHCASKKLRTREFIKQYSEALVISVILQTHVLRRHSIAFVRKSRSSGRSELPRDTPPSHE